MVSVGGVGGVGGVMLRIIICFATPCSVLSLYLYSRLMHPTWIISVLGDQERNLSLVLCQILLSVEFSHRQVLIKDS